MLFSSSILLLLTGGVYDDFLNNVGMGFVRHLPHQSKCKNRPMFFNGDAI